MSRYTRLDDFRPLATATPRRDITAFIEAACVARSISRLPESAQSEGRIDRRHATAVRRDGWYEGGNWFEPPERRKLGSGQRSVLG